MCKKDFRNSSQNRKAVNIEREGRFNTKFNVKNLPTLFFSFKK